MKGHPYVMSKTRKMIHRVLSLEELSKLTDLHAGKMSDYDEYFTDDVLLDDQTLAILEHEERKYIDQSNNNASPPSKRQRTNNGWTVGIGLRKTISDIPESLPEISLESDGSYGVLRTASQTQNSTGDH